MFNEYNKNCPLNKNGECSAKPYYMKNYPLGFEKCTNIETKCAFGYWMLIMKVEIMESLAKNFGSDKY